VFELRLKLLLSAVSANDFAEAIVMCVYGLSVVDKQSSQVKLMSTNWKLSAMSQSTAELTRAWTSKVRTFNSFLHRLHDGIWCTVVLFRLASIRSRSTHSTTTVAYLNQQAQLVVLNVRD
jgi:hypothetical protein